MDHDIEGSQGTGWQCELIRGFGENASAIKTVRTVNDKRFVWCSRSCGSTRCANLFKAIVRIRCVDRYYWQGLKHNQ
jgi:hypothetical protein